MKMRSALPIAGAVVVVVAAGVGAWMLTTIARRGAAVAATVNGEPIYWSQVDAEIRRTAAQFGMDPAGQEFAKQRDEITKAVVDQLVARQLIMQEARKRNLVAADKDVDEQLAAIRQRLPSEKAFNEALTQYGFTLQTLRDLIRMDLTQRRVADVVAPVAVSDDEVRAQFERHRAQYDRPAQIRVGHILFRGGDKSQEAVAQAKLRIVQAKLAEGAKFEDLASQYSDDSGSAAQGGSLGFVAKGTLVKEFEEAAWALRPGQVSGPVKTQYGVHLIKVYEMKDAEKATFDKVKEQIRAQLLQSKREKAFEAWLEAQRKSARIERFTRS
ncbi:MAG: peptidylprolyl isomerase [Armatimonadota bacterium]|nr:peptidylprolyl isomerase [Armatimonadota bacterium]MDR7518167.1 peptidylprolyl isomerase [Armatimonadota bacterium]MDR7550584.1 peptidylprolyl isomerase [Armatimonadota bacterium]